MSEESTNPTLPDNVPADARCLCCGTRTQSLQPEEGPMDGATAWYSSGNYGSRVLDSALHPEEPRLEIHICDLCLVLHRERVLQYDAREDRQDRGYTKWDVPKIGPDMRRRVLVIWETEDGKFVSADREGGSGFGGGFTYCLEQTVERLIRSDEYQVARSSVAACREEMHKSVRESDDPVPPMVVARCEQLLDVIAQRYPSAKCWARADDIGYLDCTGEEPDRVTEIVIRLETKVFPGVYAEVILRESATFVRVGEGEPVTVEGFDVDWVFGLIVPQGKIRA
jgi:hypothetical protein